MPESRTSPRRLEARDRRLQALALRRSGASYDEIASQLGYRGRSSAYDAVASLLRDTAQEASEEVRTLELARLDRLMMAHWTKATGGDVRATEIVLRIMERRAKILGLDKAPVSDIEDWLREQARREGLDPDQAVADAQRLVRDHARDWGVR